MFLRAFLYTPLRSLLSCSSALFVCKACSSICFLLPPSSSRWLYLTTLSHPMLAICKNVWGTPFQSLRGPSVTFGLPDGQARRDHGHASFLRHPASPLLRFVVAEPDQTVILGDCQAVIAKGHHLERHSIAHNGNSCIRMLLKVSPHRRELGMQDDLRFFPCDPRCPLRLQLHHALAQRLHLLLGLPQLAPLDGAFPGRRSFAQHLSGVDHHLGEREVIGPGPVIFPALDALADPIARDRLVADELSCHHELLLKCHPVFQVDDFAVAC